MTTNLFQLVVDDNTLAFLDYEGDSTEPFNVLFGAIADAVFDALYEAISEAQEVQS